MRWWIEKPVLAPDCINFFTLSNISAFAMIATFMEDVSIKNIKNCHFIGIGGIGISAIARMMLHEGKKVSGSDRESSRPR